MKSIERARRVMDDIRSGPVVANDAARLGPRPERSERIIAAALAEARAHGAAVVLVVLRTHAKLGESVITKLAGIIEEALEIDETVSSEP